MIEVGWIVEKANGALAALLVQKDLKGLSIDKGIAGEVSLLWYEVVT